MVKNFLKTDSFAGYQVNKKKKYIFCERFFFQISYNFIFLKKRKLKNLQISFYIEKKNLGQSMRILNFFLSDIKNTQ